MRQIFIIFFVALPLIALSAKKQPILLGRVESIQIIDGQFKVDAKMDTGAYMSSLHADEIKIYSKKGEQRVAFKYQDPQSGKVYSFDRPLIREAKIKKRSGEMKKDGEMYSTRPVVILEICLAGRQKKIELNLTNRSHFRQKMLFGRKSMNAFSVMINPALEFLTVPNCS